MSSLTSQTGVEHVSFWLPETIIDSHDIALNHGFQEEFILNKLGIRERRVLENGLDVSDMAAAAVKRVLEETDTAAYEVGLLILVSQTPDFSLPHTSAVVQMKADISEHAMVFDVSLGCSGFVIGLDIALAMMERLGIEKGILVTADAYSRIVNPGDRATAPLFGDGASATLLSTKPRWLLGQTDYGSRGSSHEKLILRGSGTSIGPRETLYMDGRGILDFTRSVVPQSVKRALELNNLALRDVDRFIFHQANSFVLDIVQSSLGIDDDKMVRSFEDVGNTTSSSIPIALRREIIDGDGVSKSILIAGFGVGLSWASSILSSVE